MKLMACLLVLGAAACGSSDEPRDPVDGHDGSDLGADGAGDIPGDGDPDTLAPSGDFGWEGSECPTGTTLAEDAASDPRARWCEKPGGVRHGPFGRWHVGDGTKAEGGEYADGVATGTWRTWYPEGALASEGPRDGSGRTGTWTTWRADRTRESVGGYVADEPDGAWVWYWPDGTTRQEGAYRGGARDGTWRTHYPDGAPDEVVTWAAGVQQGAYSKAWPDGGEAEAGQYAAGSKTGEWTTWHDSGEMASRGAYVLGLQDGVWRTWDREGLPASEGPFADGVQQGTWSLWSWQQGERIRARGEVIAGGAHGLWLSTHDPGGEPAGEVRYHYGSREGASTTIWKSGNTQNEGSYLANAPQGPWKFYYPDGALFIDALYQQGRLHGEYREYYPDASPKAEGTYQEGYKVGLWTYWDESGNIRTEGAE